MSRRTTAVVVSFVATLAVAPFAGAAETKASPETRKAAQDVAAAAKIAATAPLPLSAIFAEVSDNLEILTGPHGFVISRVMAPDVVVARINADGSRETACVNSEAAARGFIAAGRTATRPVKEPKE